MRRAYAALCLAAIWIAVSGAAVSQVARSQQELGQEAMSYIASRFVIDSEVLVPQTKKPLSTRGNWTVSKTTPAACLKINSPCVLVSYTEPATGIFCQWTVLIRGGVDKDFLVDLNEDAARYLTESPAKEKPLVPGLLSGPKGVSGGKVAECTVPLYSKDAKLARPRGTVKLLIRYDETGHPIEVKALSGPEVLQALASDTYRHCVYTPLKIDGVPISIANLKVIDYDDFD
jgi:hypothetical protein